MLLNALFMPWAFYMKYDTHQKQMTLELSHQMLSKLHVSFDELILENEDIKSFVHKYDYRKLEYFGHLKTDGPFDTTFRFKSFDGKSYLRTHAICQKSSEGFSCVLFEDQVLNQLGITYKNIIKQDQHVQIELDEQELEKTLDNRHEVKVLKKHLTQMMARATN